MYNYAYTACSRSVYQTKGLEGGRRDLRNSYLYLRSRTWKKEGRERERREREERVKLSFSILCGKERINPRACSFDEITEAAESTAKKPKIQREISHECMKLF